MSDLQQQILTDEQRAVLKATTYRQIEEADYRDQQLRARIAELEVDVRRARRTIRCLTIVAGCREQLRATHRAEVGHLEHRIDQLRILVADLLGTFTEHDRPDCGSPRVRSRWIDARTLRSWRNQIVTAEPVTAEPEGADQ